MVKTLETSILSGEHEWRNSVSVWVFGVKEAIISRADQETDESKTKDIEPWNLIRDFKVLVFEENLQSDTPEDLLDGTWEGLGWVLGLSSGKTDKLSTGESKGSNDEDGAESTESVLESTGVVPKAGTPVLAVTATLWSTTANEDECNQHEDDGGAELEDGGEELLLGVSKSTENVGDDDEDPEDGDPNGHTGIFIPVSDSKGNNSQFKR